MQPLPRQPAWRRADARKGGAGARGGSAGDRGWRPARPRRCPPAPSSPHGPPLLPVRLESGFSREHPARALPQHHGTVRAGTDLEISESGL